MKKRRFINLILFLILLTAEVLIALFVHDRFVRPYLGDVLVVIVLYFFLRIFIPERFPWLPGALFVLAALVEILQYFRLAERLGLAGSPFWRTLLGSTFDWKDLLCYGAGCAVLAVYEILVILGARKGSGRKKTSCM